MTHDEIKELLGAYALDAVDGEERDRVEAHLTTCARCRAEVAEHREVAALLAHGGTDAPEGLWDRIVDGLEEAPPQLTLAPVAAGASTPPVSAQARTTRRWTARRMATSALGVAAALLIALLGLQVRDQDNRIDQLQIALRNPMTPAFETALADPGSQLIELKSDDGHLVVRGAVTEDGIGYLKADALPDLPDNRTYQLWGQAGLQLVSLGVLGGQPTITTFRADRYSAFAITEEVAAGVVQSSNPPVVAGSVTA